MTGTYEAGWGAQMRNQRLTKQEQTTLLGQMAVAELTWMRQAAFPEKEEDWELGQASVDGSVQVCEALVTDQQIRCW